MSPLLSWGFIGHLILTFLLTTTVSVLWAFYFRLSTTGHAHRAAAVDVGIIAIGMINVVGYIHDHRLAGAILAGTYCGTFWGVRLKRSPARDEPAVPPAPEPCMIPLCHCDRL